MTEEEKKKKREEENRKQLLIALALLLFPTVDERTLTVETMPEDVRSGLEKKIDDYLKKESATIEKTNITELAQMTKSDILTAAKEISGVKSRYFEVVTVGDAKTCPNCKKWDGQIISDDDNKYPSYDDFEKSGAAHYNCRCYLKPVNISTSSNSQIDDCRVVFSGCFTSL